MSRSTPFERPRTARPKGDHRMFSPRHRRRGVNISPYKYEDHDSGTESPASPLSTDRKGAHHKGHIYKYELPSIKDLCTNPQNPFMSTHKNNKKMDEYKVKLKALNTLLSPIQLFYEFDLMIKNYHALKKEYILQWELQQLYRQQIRSFVKGHKENQSHDLLMPLTDIDVLVQRLQNLQFSIMELFANKSTTVHKNPKGRTYSDKKQRYPHKNTNIRPSHAKRLSGSGFSPIAIAKQRNMKKTQQKQRKKGRKWTDNFVNNGDDHNYHHHIPYLPPLTLTLNTSYSYSKSRRRSSVRSFGSLYSDEFRSSVATHYKQHMSLFDDFKSHHETASHASSSWNETQIVNYYHDDYIGQKQAFESPFGTRNILYCDWTASGKPLNCIENYIRDEILPFYANTHTTTSVTGIQTSKYRSEARSIILQSIQADQNQDVVLFCGSGSTAAIYKMAHVLLTSFGDKPYTPTKTVVFISVYEHNSNIFIWKELGCNVIVIPETRNTKKGGIDLNILEKRLQFYTSSHMKHKYTLLIGSFTAASNVSGILAPIEETTALLHRYNALSFWDFATAGPYCNIEMSNKEDPMLSKDAVFLSAHKYIGGPGAPGILCAKKKLFTNYIPVVPGGGTVFMAHGVDDGQWAYLDNIEEREEGGTGDIIGSIRAALTFMIKDHLSTTFIENREKKYLEYFWKECKSIHNLIMMGNTECDRLPVLSFLITHTKKGFGAATKTKYLHYNFIAALMNDMFGIQGRGGCACAGMYGKHVLNISDKEVDHVVEQLRDNRNELSRPGYFRINLHYTLNKEELMYIINVIKFVCSKGWLFLSLYDVDPETGNYFHRDANTKNKTNLKSLLDVSFTTSNNGHAMVWQNSVSCSDSDTSTSSNNDNNLSFNKFLHEAQKIIEHLRECMPSIDDFKNEQKICDESAWYWLPSELYQDTIEYLQ